MKEDKISDAFARVYNARDNLREALNFAIEALEDQEGVDAGTAYNAALIAKDELEDMQDLQLLIDTLEEML